MQILDRNFHPKIVNSLKDSEKRGRPDVVHFAILDVTSTPVFEIGLIELLVRTRQGICIKVNEGTRPPRTLQRFCGVTAKLLTGSSGKKETDLFTVKRERSFAKVLDDFKIEKVISLSSQGSIGLIRDLAIEEARRDQKTAWVVGGFPFGHFSDEVIEKSDMVVSISNKTLPAHVVTARLCYELEQALMI